MDLLTHSVLFFNHWPFIVCLLIFGFIFGDRELFYHTTCIMLVSMILNVALKVTFQIPLSPTLHKIGYAFPSGHMQLATVLYGSLALGIKHKGFRVLMIALLGAIAYSIVYFGYHNWFDIAGAVVFASLILGVYQHPIFKNKLYFIWANGLSTTLAMLYIASQENIPTHAWMAYSILLILMIMVPVKIWIQSKV